ncbi:MAG: sulfatase [Phycisphaerae bacterium]
MTVNRRQFLKGVGAAAALTAAGGTVGCGPAAQSAPAIPPASKPNRPNIVLIIGDDHTYTDAGCYGNKDVKTPNIDRLAAQGMRFTNAHTASAMCVPTRSMLYTGLYPVKTGAYPNHSLAYGNVKCIAQYLKELGYRVVLAGKVHVGPKEVFAFDYIKATESKVEEVLTGRGPFCLIYASIHPHIPWRRGLYEPDKLTVPPYMVDTPETRQALADYYYEVTQLDKEVGMCLDLLDKHKLADDTLTIYTSEQGAQFPHGKWTCYDVGLRTQFIARWPGRIKAGTTSDAMICYADFVPTAVEVAGGRPIPNLDGISLLPILTGRSDKGHDAVFGVQTTRGIIRGSECYPIRSIRTTTHKYIWNLKPDAAFQNVVTAEPPDYWKSWLEEARIDPKAKQLVDGYQHRPEEELYDLRADPWEMKNIASDPANAIPKAALRKQLEAFMKDQGDKGIQTEMEAKSRQPPDRQERD